MEPSASNDVNQDSTDGEVNNKVHQSSPASPMQSDDVTQNLPSKKFSGPRDESDGLAPNFFPDMNAVEPQNPFFYGSHEKTVKSDFPHQSGTKGKRKRNFSYDERSEVPCKKFADAGGHTEDNDEQLILDFVKSNRTQLEQKYLEPRFGLIPELIANKFLNESEEEAVKSDNNPSKMNECIIGYLLDRTPSQLNNFLSALEQSDQKHVAYFIRSRKADTSDSNVRPLSDEERERIRINMPKLLKQTEPGDLIGHLLASGCINEYMKEHIDSESVRYKKIEELVSILRKRSYSDFEKFLRALEQTSQSHVAELLKKRGAIMTATSTISKTLNLSEEEIKETDGKLVETMERLLHKTNKEEFEKIFEYALLIKQGVIIVDAHTGSVELLMWCDHLSGLQRLHEWLVNGRVKDIVKQLFNKLLNRKSDSKLSFDVEWSEEEYSQCVKYFKLWEGEHSGNQQQSSSGHHRPDRKRPSLIASAGLGMTSDSNMDIPPIDDSEFNTVLWGLVRELILERAIVSFYKFYNRTTLYPEPLIYEALSPVCGYWWIEIQRPGYRRRIRKLLNDMCGPYRREWMRSHRLESASSGSKVRGVSYLDGHIYVVYSEGPRGIGVYLGMEPYTRLQSIYIDDMRFPLDASACPTRHLLYVADWAGGGDRGGKVWQISPRPNFFATTPLDKIEKPRKLSINNDQMLITSGKQLIFYNLNGFAEMRRIELPADIKEPQHAVITPSGTFLVSHGQEADVPHRVTELSADGKRVIRYYGGLERGEHIDGQLSWPAHLSLGDGDGRIILADCDNSRLLMLTPDLKLERLLINKEEHDINTPRRLCYVKESGILLVGIDFGYVDIYPIKRLQR